MISKSLRNLTKQSGLTEDTRRKIKILEELAKEMQIEKDFLRKEG